MAKYCVVDRPGYFGNKARVYSCHRTIKAAKKRLGRGYVDEKGTRRQSTCIVETEKKKGSFIWGDSFPKVVA